MFKRGDPKPTGQAWRHLTLQQMMKLRTSDCSWLGRMLERKPRMLVAVALANRIARIAWALMAKVSDGVDAPDGIDVPR